MGGHPIMVITTGETTESSYYNNGNSDIAQETVLTEQRLEAVRQRISYRIHHPSHIKFGL